MADSGDDKTLARASQLVLVATMIGDPMPLTASYLVVPRIAPCSATQLVDRLAAADKPLICVSFRVLDWCGVACWSKAMVDQDLSDDLTAEGAVEYLAFLASSTSLNARVDLLVEPPVVMSVREWIAWFESYRFPLANFHIEPTDYPGSEAEPIATIRVSRAAGGYLHGLDGDGEGVRA